MVRLYAFFAVAALVALMFLYAREFEWFSNTIGAGRLVTIAFLLGLIISGGVIWYFRDRFTPIKKHLPEIGVIGLFITVFSPLMVSLLNRLPGKSNYEQFIFKSEQAYLAHGYGILKTESIRPTGWILTVERNGHQYQFKYKEQPYFPITQPGEIIELPIRHGVLGFDLVEL